MYSKKLQYTMSVCQRRTNVILNNIHDTTFCKQLAQIHVHKLYKTKTINMQFVQCVIYSSCLNFNRP